jgi:hypothetical protein
MLSRFTVTSQTADVLLLSIDELRSAAGLSDASEDVSLRALGEQVSVAIARACGIAGDGVNMPTVKRETCSEVFRLEKCLPRLTLARRPVASISSLHIGSDEQASTAYEFDVASGRVSRLSGDCEIDWPKGKITVAYVAGYETVPADLKLAASKAVALLYTETGRDSNLKRENIPGVIEREWWVSPSTDPLLSNEILELLAPYRQYWI